MKLKIGSKISLGFALIVILMIIIGGYSIVGFHQMKNINKNIQEVITPGVDASKELQIATLETTVAMRGYILTGDQGSIDDFERFNEEVQIRLDRSDEYALTDLEKEYVRELKTFTNEYNSMSSNIFTLKKSGRDEVAISVMESLAYPKVQEIRAKANELIDLKEEELARENQELQTIQRNVNITILVIGILGLILSIVISTLITMGITRPINRFVHAAKKVAEGDLENQIEVRTNDEISILAEAFNTMIINLRDIIGKINIATQNVASTSEELSSSSEEMSLSTTEVTRTISEVAAAANDEADFISKSSNIVYEMQEEAKNISESMEQVSRTSYLTLDSVEEGLEDAEDAVERINNIRKSTLETSQVILGLNESSQEIEGIVDSINSISEQTNLLALNAAIEAARAGETGRGFAVVADEIRKLAEESSRSTDKIANLIYTIQEEIKAVVNSMDESNIDVDKGVEVINRVSSSFTNIFNETTKVSKEIDNTLVVVQNINDKTNNVTENFENMSAISEETAASAEEVAASSEEQAAAMEEVASSANGLADIAEELVEAISIFKY